MDPLSNQKKNLFESLNMLKCATGYQVNMFIRLNESGTDTCPFYFLLFIFLKTFYFFNRIKNFEYFKLASVVSSEDISVCRCFFLDTFQAETSPSEDLCA